MRVLFYARPWNIDLQMAVEDHWRSAGEAVEPRYVAHQFQAVEELRAAGRDATFIPDEISKVEVRDSEAALEEFERRNARYLLPLMRYVMSERFFRERDRRWQLDQLARHALWLERLYEEFRPQLLVGESADLMPVWLAYSLAPKYDCEVVGLMPSTIPPGRLLLLRDFQTIAGAREHYEELRAAGLAEKAMGAARALQDIVTGKGTKLDYLPPKRRYADFARRLLKGQVLREHLGTSLWQLRERRAGNWFVQPDPILMQLLRPAEKLRAAVADHRYLTDAEPSRPFAFYPLHFEPEATTMVHGSYYENQLELIHNIARSLPAGWKLVVKEHFFMRGQRRLADYRRLLHVPNLVLVPFSVPTNRLIQECRVLTTISSTAGLEAALIGKPVVMFGDYPWEYGPTIHKAGALSELPALIQHAAGSALGPDHPDVLAFGASWDAALPPGRYYRTRQYDWTDPGNVALIADSLRRAATERTLEPS
jgi:hypothetical protein